MRPKNQYFLLRHGDTTWNNKLVYPAIDSPLVQLSDKGVKKIKTVAKRLKRENIDKIYSSDFYRTKQTAGIAAQELGLGITLDKRLRDINLGIYRGKRKTLFYNAFSNLEKRFKVGPKEGESWDDLKRRVKAFVKDIETKYHGKRILIVSHGDPLWLFEGIIHRLNDRELLKMIFVNKEYIKKGELRKL